MIYLFGPLNKEKLKPTLPPEELNKLIMNPENDVLYGTVNIILTPPYFLALLWTQ